MQCAREKTNVGPSEFKRKGAQKEAQERGGANRNHIINGWRHIEYEFTMYKHNNSETGKHAPNPSQA
jgi:hypothetical protein